MKEMPISFVFNYAVEGFSIVPMKEFSFIHTTQIKIKPQKTLISYIHPFIHPVLSPSIYLFINLLSY